MGDQFQRRCLLGTAGHNGRWRIDIGFYLRLLWNQQRSESLSFGQVGEVLLSLVASVYVAFAAVDRLAYTANANSGLVFMTKLYRHGMGKDIHCDRSVKALVL